MASSPTTFDINHASEIDCDLNKVVMAILPIGNRKETAVMSRLELPGPGNTALELEKTINPEVFKNQNMVWGSSNTNPHKAVGINLDAVRMFDHDRNINIGDPLGAGHIVPMDPNQFYHYMAPHMDRFTIMARLEHEKSSVPVATYDPLGFDPNNLVHISIPHSPGAHTASVTLLNKEMPPITNHITKDMFNGMDMVWFESPMLPDHSVGMNLAQVPKFFHDVSDPGVIRVFDKTINTKSSEGFGTHLPVTLKAFYETMAPHMKRYRVVANTKWDSERPTYGDEVKPIRKDNAKNQELPIWQLGL